MTTEELTALAVRVQALTGPAALEIVLRANFGTRIDDTPADTEEHDMTEWSRETVRQIDETVATLRGQPGTMTITQEQFDAAVAAYMSAPMGKGMGVFVAALGITIAPPEPPEAMVKLAAEAGASWVKSEDACVEPRSAFSRGYIAALQHAVGMVKNAPIDDNQRALKSHILTALGAP